VFDLEVQRLARAAIEDGGDVVIELSVLAVQGHHRDADHGEDETQLLYVLAEVLGERVIREWRSG